MDGSHTELSEFQSESLQLVLPLLDLESGPSVLYPANGPIEPVSRPPYYYVRAGDGKVSGPKCGRPKFTLACPSEDLEHRLFSQRLISEHCSSFSCPVCVDSASSRASQRIRLRLEGLHAKYLEQGVRLGVPKHIEFSPPQDLFTLEDLLQDGGKSAWSAVDKVLRESAQGGVYAGVVIVHLERKRHKDGTECGRHGCTRRHVWIWGPHFHFIGYGFFQRSDDFYQATDGWVYKRIAEKAGDRDIASTAFYVLTHSASFVKVETGRSAKNYRYVGLFAPSKVQVRKLGTGKEPCKCSCQLNLHKYALPLGFNEETGHLERLPEIDTDTDLGEYFRTVPIYEFVIKGGPRARDAFKFEVIKRHRQKPID